MTLVLNLFLMFLILRYETIYCEIVKDCVNENCTLNYLENEPSSRIISRRKRFIIFPDGSSLQLVFCLQTAALIPIGDIFLYGNTVALAWNLPNDPKFLTMYKDHREAQRRGDTTRKIIYVDSTGKVLAQVPYKRPFIVNPAFAKRSIDDSNLSYKERLKIKIERKKMHEKEGKKDNLIVNHMQNEDFHRKTRIELYGKIETMLTALGQDGRTCVLYKLCEAARRRSGQGTFQQEFLRAVFTLPKVSTLKTEDHNEYDAAHNDNIDCSERYSGCEDLTINI